MGFTNVKAEKWIVFIALKQSITYAIRKRISINAIIIRIHHWLRDLLDAKHYINPKEQDHFQNPTLKSVWLYGM
jgi:hypothetical protein